MVQTINKTQTPGYRAYIRSVLQMFVYLDEKKFESAEADELREKMVGPWYELSAAEKARMDGLVMDLYYIREPGRGIEGPIERGRDKLIAASNLKDKGDLDGALDHLRASEKEIFQPFLSFFRGRVWTAFEVHEVAVEFLRDAWQLDKANQNFQGMYLQAMMHADLREAKKMADAIAAAPQESSVTLVVHALEVVRACIDEDSIGAKEQHRKIVPLLEFSINRMMGGGEPLNPAVLSMCVVHLAESYEFLGRINEARDAITFAMNFEGDNPVLYAARGKLLYPKEEGVQDLLRAIQFGIPSVWPYLWVAEYLLKQSRYQDSITICEAGVVRETTAQIRSELLELAAIAKASLGYSSEEVQRQFELAIEMDDSNARAKHNLNVFKQAVERAVANKPSQYNWTRIPDEYFVKVEKSERERRFAHVSN